MKNIRKILNKSKNTQQWRKVPLLSDKAPELISHNLAAWVEGHCAELVFIQPGKLAQNA